MRTIALLLCSASLLVADKQVKPRNQRYPGYYSETLSAPAKVSQTTGAQKPSDESLRRKVGLRYWIIYTRKGEDTPRIGDPSRVYSNGDRVKLQVESNIDGYLYIWIKGSSGKEQLLFPNPKIDGGRNDVRSWQKLTVPTQGWFAITEKPGDDVLTIIVSRTPLSDTIDKQDEGKTYLAMRQRLPSDTRDFEFVTEEEPPADRPEQPKAGAIVKPASFIVVNSNTNVNDSVYATVTIRHR